MSECIGGLRHMQRYFSHISVYVTAQMCRRTEEEAVPTAVFENDSVHVQTLNSNATVSESIVHFRCYTS